MKNKRCWLACAGEFYAPGFLPAEGDVVIAVDAGYVQLEKMNIYPDLVVGDFDSLNFVPKHPNIVLHPAEKDDTDSMLAVKEGVSLGCTEFFILGATGGRLAHTLANLQVLAFLAGNGLSGYIIDEKTVITAVKNGSLHFGGDHCGYISVFPHGCDAGNVTLTGLKYPLNEAVLPADRPLGVSNEFTGVPSRVRIGSGTAIVLWQNNTGALPEREEEQLAN